VGVGGGQNDRDKGAIVEGGVIVWVVGGEWYPPIGWWSGVGGGHNDRDK
jgi:hypothetical protein